MKQNPLRIELIERSLNYTDREGQLSDNYSNLFTGNCTKFEIQVLRKMEKEDLVWFEDIETARDCDRGPDDLVVYLTEDCINDYFDWRETFPKTEEKVVEKPVDKLSQVMEIANIKSDIDKLTADYELKLKEMMDLLNEKLQQI